MKRPAEGAGLTLVMTDLFVSAASVLLIVLALAAKAPPQPLPEQADLVALCPAEPDGPFLLMTAVQAVAAHSENTAPQGLAITSADDVPRLGELSGLFPGLLHTVALMGGPGAPLDAACLIRFRRDIVGRHNDELAKQPSGEGFRRILAVAPAATLFGRESQ